MTDLQIGLAVIGALAVAAVLLYNRWQERGVRREAERAFGSGHGDALMDTRREPTLEPRRPPVQPGATPADGIDYVIDLTLRESTPAAVVREAWTPIEQRFARRVLLAVDHLQVKAGLQLVSRAGVVSDAEVLEFRALVETMAARLGAAVHAPEMRPALEAARELDRVCADVDIQVALHVVGIGFTPAEFSGQAFQAAPREDGVTLTLDVARTLEPARGYEAMARAGRQLAQARGGRLVDDTGRELDERALAAIGTQLDAVRARLAGCGIEPGSPLALRVFS
ncbi:MAG TPA: cell division protein ZipA C-terminal FtsZ-binding domain-containing protein [Burkholderiales bacterium]